MREFTEIGAGLGLWSRALNVFKDADIYEACAKIAVAPDADNHGKWDTSYGIMINMSQTLLWR